jgi:hypothetical protein
VPFFHCIQSRQSPAPKKKSTPHSQIQRVNEVGSHLFENVRRERASKRERGSVDSNLVVLVKAAHASQKIGRATAAVTSGDHRGVVRGLSAVHAKHPALELDHSDARQLRPLMDIQQQTLLALTASVAVAPGCAL